MLVLKLVAEDKIALDSTISTYLTGYAGPGADRITIHHLLSHWSGIPIFTSFDDYQSRIMRLEWEPDSLVSTFARRSLDFEPGSQYSYSNSGYFLLGVIVEEGTGQSYSEALKKKVLVPLGLDGPVGYAHDDRVIRREANGYEQTVWGDRPAEPIDSSVPLSAGMLYASPKGLHQWTQALHAGRLFLETHEGQADVGIDSLGTVEIDTHEGTVSVTVPPATGFDFATNLGEEAALGRDH